MVLQQSGGEGVSTIFYAVQVEPVCTCIAHAEDIKNPNASKHTVTQTINKSNKSKKISS